MDAELARVEAAVSELRGEIKSSRPDPEKLERINDFISDYEEKIAQPILQAKEAAKNLQEDFAELKQKMEESGVTHAEAKERVDALELELATRHTHQTAEDPTAYRGGDEFKALSTWVRLGDKRVNTPEGPVFVTDEQKQLLRTDINGEGGFLVPDEMDSVIVKKITEIDPIRSISRVRTIGGKSINLPIRNSIPIATYEAETEAGTDSTSTYVSELVTPFRQTFTTPITWDMLQDAAFDMESEIMSDAAEAFAFGEGNGFVVGTGVKEPSGFVANAILQANARPSASGETSSIAPEDLILLTGDLKVGYDPLYVLNRRTLAQIRIFRSDSGAGAGTGEFLWRPGLNGPTENTLNGFPYILANSMPDIGADAFCVAFGDFRRGYTIVDRTGLAVIRDDTSLKKQAIVEFTMHRWNTGQVTLTEPIKLLQATSA